jgi:hypothetical protein
MTQRDLVGLYANRRGQVAFSRSALRESVSVVVERSFSITQRLGSIAFSQLGRNSQFLWRPVDSNGNSFSTRSALAGSDQIHLAQSWGSPHAAEAMAVAVEGLFRQQIVVEFRDCHPSPATHAAENLAAPR